MAGIGVIEIHFYYQTFNLKSLHSWSIYCHSTQDHKCTFPNIIPHLICNSFFINSLSALVVPFNNLIFKLNQTLYYHPETVLWSSLSCCQQITEFIWAEIQSHKPSWKISSMCFPPYRTQAGWFLSLCKQVYIKHTRVSGQNSGLWKVLFVSLFPSSGWDH